MAKFIHPKWIADPPPEWIVKKPDLVSKYTILAKEFEKRFVNLQKEFDKKVNEMKR
jgi:hypothetical protein